MPLTPEEQQELQQLKLQTAADAGDRGAIDILKQQQDPEYGAINTNSEILVDPIDMGGSFASGAAKGLSAGARAVGNATGISKIPGSMLAKFLGNKMTADTGSTLLQEGVIGTRGMIGKQIGKRIGKRGAELDTAVSKIKTPIDSEKVADRVRQAGNKFQTSTGRVPKEVEPEFNKIMETAQDIRGRGAIDKVEALELKRIADGIGHSKDKPLAKLSSQLAREEARGYGQLLEEGYEQAVPGAPNAVKEANKQLSALYRGKSALQKGPVPGLGVGLPGKTLEAFIKSSTAPVSVAAQGMRAAGNAVTSTPVMGTALSQAVKQVPSDPVSPPSLGLTPEEAEELAQLKAGFK